MQMTLPGTTVKAVTLDADDTLWNFDEAMRAGLTQVISEIRRLAPTESDGLTVEAMIVSRDRAEADLKGSGASLIAVRREGIRRSLPGSHAGDDALVDRLLAAYVGQRDRVLTPFDDAIPALRLLKGKAVLGVVSNGNARPERHGLGGFFTFVLLSDDHGIEKPDPQVFEMAADAAGCAVSEIVHVGDNPLTDVAGANQAGALSVWLNRSGRTLAPGEPGPLREIGSLRELPRLVESMAGG